MEYRHGPEYLSKPREAALCIKKPHTATGCCFDSPLTPTLTVRCTSARAPLFHNQAVSRCGLLSRLLLHPFASLLFECPLY